MTAGTWRCVECGQEREVLALEDFPECPNEICAIEWAEAATVLGGIQKVLPGAGSLEHPATRPVPSTNNH